MRSVVELNSVVSDISLPRPFIFLVVITIFLATVFASFMTSQAVNIPYADQWPFYQEFKTHPSLQELFTFQYGPHRQGLGMLLTFATANISSWDMRAETIANVVIQMCTSVVLLWLKWRIFSKWHYTDMVIPMSVLSIQLFESFVSVPNVSLFVLPLLMLSLCALAWTFSGQFKHYFVATVAGLLTFTGFGILTVPSIIALYAIDFHNAHRPVLIGSIAAISISMLLFFRGYIFDPASGCDPISLPLFGAYPYFLGSLIMNSISLFHQTPPGFYFLGCLGFIALCYLYVLHVKTYRRSPKLNASILLLMGSGITLLAATTIGRTCIGIQASQAPRYLIFFIPIWIAVYFLYLSHLSAGKYSSIIFLMLCVVTSGMLNTKKAVILSNQLKTHKQDWLTCYRRTESIQHCNRTLGFTLLAADEVEEEVLQYAKDHSLLFYAD